MSGFDDLSSEFEQIAKIEEFETKFDKYKRNIELIKLFDTREKENLRSKIAIFNDAKENIQALSFKDADLKKLKGTLIQKIEQVVKALDSISPEGDISRNVYLTLQKDIDLIEHNIKALPYYREADDLFSLSDALFKSIDDLEASSWIKGWTGSTAKFSPELTKAIAALKARKNKFASDIKKMRSIVNAEKKKPQPAFESIASDLVPYSDELVSLLQNYEEILARVAAEAIQQVSQSISAESSARAPEAKPGNGGAASSIGKTKEDYIAEYSARIKDAVSANAAIEELIEQKFTGIAIDPSKIEALREVASKIKDVDQAALTSL